MFPLRDMNPSRSTPWVTWSVILACIVVFVFEAIQPEIVRRELLGTYALVPARITSLFTQAFDAGAVVSVFTSMFMHRGWLHIAGNMWFLQVFGDRVEDRFGSVRYAGFYVAAGIAAAGVQWAIDPSSNVPMVGASGAVAGVLAAYLVLFPSARIVTFVTVVVFSTVREMPAWVLIGAYFILQVVAYFASRGAHAGDGVAYWAHIGGFAAGLVMAFIFRRPTETEPPPYVSRFDPDTEWH